MPENKKNKFSYKKRTQCPQENHPIVVNTKIYSGKTTRLSRKGKKKLGTPKPKDQVTHEDQNIKLTTDFSTAAFSGKKQWNILKDIPRKKL